MEFIKMTKDRISTMFGKVSNSAVGQYSTTSIRVYSGPRPTKAQYNAISTSAGLDALAVSLGGKILFSAALATGNNTYFSSSNGKLLIPASPYTAAVNAGDATWFAISLGTGTASSIFGWITGDISDMAGNGDLKITTRAVVQGNSYKTMDFSITMPNELTW